MMTSWRGSEPRPNDAGGVRTSWAKYAVLNPPAPTRELTEVSNINWPRYERSGLTWNERLSGFSWRGEAK